MKYPDFLSERYYLHRWRGQRDTEPAGSKNEIGEIAMMTNYAIIENAAGRFWYLTEATSDRHAAEICERDTGNGSDLEEANFYDLHANRRAYVVYEISEEVAAELDPMDGGMEEAVELIQAKGTQRGAFCRLEVE